MSEFLLIAPNDANEVEVDLICNMTSIPRTSFLDLSQGVGLADFNTSLKANDFLPEGKEVSQITYMPEFDRLWLTYIDV